MTKNIDFYFDFVSPYTYIGHKRIELEGNEFNFTYKPILLAGLHKLWGITPQAFIASKKQFIFLFPRQKHPSFGACVLKIIN